MTGVHIMVSCHPWGGLNESFRKCLPELDDCPSHLCATHAGRGADEALPALRSALTYA